MRRIALFVILVAVLPACGGDGGDGRGSTSQSGEQQTPKQGLVLSVSHDELRTGQPVTWKLQVENAGPQDATLVFRSGKDGDVTLVRDGREAYRWSANRYFSQAMRQEQLKPGEQRTFTLEDKGFSAEAGDYELMAELASEPAPPPARRSVEVKG